MYTSNIVLSLSDNTTYEARLKSSYDDVIAIDIFYCSTVTPME